MDVKLEFDIMCEKTVDFPRYRVIVNSELMTERDYRWDNKLEYVRELVPMRLEPGVHELEVQNLDPHKGTFSINNITVNGEARQLFNGREFKV